MSLSYEFKCINTYKYHRIPKNWTCDAVHRGCLGIQDIHMPLVTEVAKDPWWPTAQKKHRSTYRYLQILQEDETKNWLVVSNIFPECVAKGSVRSAALTSPCLWGELQNLVRSAALTSPCLWGKLQKLSLCLSFGTAVSMGEAAKPRSFCCAHIAVSMGEAAQPQSLPVLWHRRVYRGSCKTSIVLLRSHRRVYVGSCKTSVSACPLASPCLWGKLQNLACFAALTSPCLWGKLQSRVYKGSCKTSLVLLRRVSAFPRLCASFVVESKTGTCFVQAL